MLQEMRSTSWRFGRFRVKRTFAIASDSSEFLHNPAKGMETVSISGRSVCIDGIASHYEWSGMHGAIKTNRTYFQAGVPPESAGLFAVVDRASEEGQPLSRALPTEK